MHTYDYDRLIAGLNVNRRAVFDALRKRGPMTDDEIIAAVAVKAGTVRARRSELVRIGLVREVGRRPTADGRSGTRIWGLVPPDKVEDAASEAQQRGPRRIDVRKLPLEERVGIARVLLQDHDVNEELRTAASGVPSSRIARARARQEQERQQRARREELRRAEEAGHEHVAFLKALDHLKRNVEAMREVGRFLEAEVELYARGDATQVPESAWKRVLTQIEDSMEVAEEMRHRIGRHLGEPDRAAVLVLKGDIDITHAKPVGEGTGNGSVSAEPIGDASTDS